VQLGIKTYFFTCFCNRPWKHNYPHLERLSFIMKRGRVPAPPRRNGERNYNGGKPQLQMVTSTVVPPNIGWKGRGDFWRWRFLKIWGTQIFKSSPSFASNGQDAWQLFVCYRGAECAIPFQILNLARQNLKILDEETISFTLVPLLIKDSQLILSTQTLRWTHRNMPEDSNSRLKPLCFIPLLSRCLLFMTF
jgi:hypothetical protein